jgi:hypothetical protein
LSAFGNTGVAKVGPDTLDTNSLLSFVQVAGILGSFMTPRSVLAVLLVLMSGPAAAQVFVPQAKPAAVRPVSRPLQSRPIVFYVAKGAPDVCGPGCDTWIAIEGQFDRSASARFRKFFVALRDRKLPIYITSPGGNLEQALTMGTLLHEKPVVVRVARTIVQECGFEAQDSDVCLKLKQSGRVLTGALWTRNAICNSACPYFLLGASTREIAPDTSLGVHSAKVFTQFLGIVTPTAEMVAAAAQRGKVRSDGLLASYFARMGADTGLLKLAGTVKFEDVHILTRDEIIRFGLDRREQAETAWQFENGVRSMAGKAVSQKSEGDDAHRLLQWRLICISTEQFELDVQRPVGQAPLPTVAVSGDDAKQLYFTPIPTRTPGSEFWGVRLARTVVDKFASEPTFDLIESSQRSDGRHVVRTALSTEGLAHAVDTLLPTCPPPRTVTLSTRDGATK